ncbi:hypothetical protein ACYULU_08335 [Breznakiellaceae bacterium SP9]
MIAYKDEIVEEVYRTRAKLLKQYGAWEGYSKHLEEQRPLLEAQGWKSMTPEEVIAKNTQASTGE